MLSWDAQELLGEELGKRHRLSLQQLVSCPSSEAHVLFLWRVRQEETYLSLAEAGRVTWERVS